jgi:hypothetical protein
MNDCERFFSLANYRKTACLQRTDWQDIQMRRRGHPLLTSGQNLKLTHYRPFASVHACVDFGSACLRYSASHRRISDFGTAIILSKAFREGVVLGLFRCFAHLMGRYLIVLLDSKVWIENPRDLISNIAATDVPLDSTIA